MSRMLSMDDDILAITHHTGIRFAEVGFLLILFAGIWLVVTSRFSAVRSGAVWTVVAGLALGVAGVLLIIATHWGHFG